MRWGTMTTEPPTAAVDETGPLSRARLRDDFINKAVPVVMREGAAHWRAVRRWTFDSIAELRPDLPVELEVGNVMQYPGAIELSTLADYVRDLHTPPRGSANGGVSYLSVFDLFGAIPELRDDVDFSLLRRSMHYTVAFGWLGPAGTVTGYHADWAHNLFAQIRGRKRFHIVPAEFRDEMYPSRRYDPYSDQSQIDLKNLDLGRFPRYRDLPVGVVDVEPGDMLYLPPRTWHHVESLEPSISANCFGYRALQGAAAFARDRLNRWRTPRDREHSTLVGRGQ